MTEHLPRDADNSNKHAYIQLYCSVLAQVPNFKNTIEDFGDDFESIMSLISLVWSRFSLRIAH